VVALIEKWSPDALLHRGAAPIYFLELVGNLILIDVKGGTVVAVSGLPPSAGYLIRYFDAAGEVGK